MKRLILILIVSLSFSSFYKLFSQQNSGILYEDPSLIIKPMPIDIESYDKWIKDNNVYYGPDSDSGPFIYTKVVINFIVDTLGNVVNPLIISGIGGPYDSEAWRLIKANPIKWTPGSINGKLVDVQVNYMIDLKNNKNSLVTKDFVRIKKAKKKKE